MNASKTKPALTKRKRGDYERTDRDTKKLSEWPVS